MKHLSTFENFLNEGHDRNINESSEEAEALNAAKAVSKNVKASGGEVSFTIESKFNSSYSGKVERKTNGTINPHTKRVWFQGHGDFYYKDSKDLIKQLRATANKVKQEHRNEFEEGEQKRAGDNLTHDAWR